ncbi:uncharacterized protein LOC144560957 [Carex rostrata]
MGSLSYYSPCMLSSQLQNERLTNSVFRQNKKRVVLALATTTNVSPGKRSSGDDIIMVDPLEAKRLAEKQMSEIKAKEKLMRRRQGEAINGALAMVGLTAGLVIEGQTGKGILGQIAGYLAAFAGIFMN